MQFDGGADLGIDFIDIELRWEMCAMKTWTSMPAMSWPGTNTFSDHGTAVLGEIIGYDNEYGVTGISHDANARMVSVNGDPATWPDVANSINTAAANLGAKIALVETGAGVANSVIKALN